MRLSGSHLSGPGAMPQDLAIVHSSRGRVRVHVPFWTGADRQQIEGYLRTLPGVRAAEARPLTRNILVTFNPDHTNQQSVLASLRLADWPADRPQGALPIVTSGPAPVVTESRGGGRQARIALHGIERNPGMLRRVMDTLHRLHGVRVRVKPLTGHVVIEYDQRRVLLNDVMARIARLDLPEGPGEDRPAHPLDPGPLLEGVTRAIGSLVGLLAITARRLANPAPAVSEGTGPASTVAGVIHLLQAFPFVRTCLRRLMGRHPADVVPSVLNITAMAFANFPLGMVVTGVEAMIFLTEVVGRRAAWRRYQEGLEAAPSIEPGAVVRIEPGASDSRAPLASPSRASGPRIDARSRPAESGGSR